MTGVLKTVLIFILLATGVSSYAQPVISGTVSDVDSQQVVGQLVEIYTDTMGLQYPYYDSTRTDMYGHYSFTLPTGLPIGIIFKVKTYNCGNPATTLHFYPYNYSNSNFNVCATGKYIKGNVYKGVNPASQASVFLIKQSLDTFTQNFEVEVIDSMNVDASGFYVFKLPMQGADSYLVKAALLPADTADYIYYIPAYHSGELKWSNADVIAHDNIVADITLPSAFSVSGQGYITGVVLDTLGDSLYKRILILTTDNDVPVGYRYSSTNGMFSFGGLSNGNYKLFGDALGKYNPPLQFSITTANQSLSKIVFIESGNAFSGSLWPLDAGNVLLNKIAVYPNPATEYLHIKGLENMEGTKVVSMVDVAGRKVFEEKIEHSDEILVPVAELISGLYLLEIISPSGRIQYKIAR